MYSPIAHLWLARSWALAGETAKAREAFEKLFVLWKDADRDLQSLVEARAEYKKLGN